MFSDFDHAMRRSLTVVLGETELVLARGDVMAEERRRSVDSLVAAVREMEQLLVQWRVSATGPLT
jgi:hypothetical protein